MKHTIFKKCMAASLAIGMVLGGGIDFSHALTEEEKKEMEAMNMTDEYEYHQLKDRKMFTDRIQADPELDVKVEIIVETAGVKLKKKDGTAFDGDGFVIKVYPMEGVKSIYEARPKKPGYSTIFDFVYYFDTKGNTIENRSFSYRYDNYNYWVMTDFKNTQGQKNIPVRSDISSFLVDCPFFDKLEVIYVPDEAKFIKKWMSLSEKEQNDIGTKSLAEMKKILLPEDNSANKAPKEVKEVKMRKKSIDFVIDNIEYNVFGNRRVLDVAPYVSEEGRTLLPVRGVAEALDAVVEWKEDTKTVTLEAGDKTIKITINDKFMMVNDKKVDLDTPATIKEGRTFLPIAQIAKELGVTVKWIGAEKRVSLTK